MTLTKPLLLTSLLLAFTSPMTFAGDDTGEGSSSSTAGVSSGDEQTITVTVPEVALIDVTDTLSVTLVAPTEAGDNFAEKTTVTGSPTYDISANVAQDTMYSTRKIVVTAGTIPEDWKFTLNVDAPTGATSVTDAEFISTTTGAVEVVTGIRNIAQKAIPISIEVGPEDTGRMPSHATEGKNVVLTYTITAEGGGEV